MPSLSSLYGCAALGAARSKLRPGSGPRTLPDRTVLAQHPGVSLEEAESYRRLFGGESFDGVHRAALPSVLVHIIGFPVQMALMSDDEFPLPLIGLVHVANEVEHLRPVRVGQPVQILVSAGNLRPHRRGTQVDITVTVLEQGADPKAAAAVGAGGSAETSVLWRSVSTYLSKGAQLGTEVSTEVSTASGAEETGSTAVTRSEDPKSFVPPVKTASWRLGSDAGRAYAAVSGDYNPIHVSQLAAKALGMPAAIVHGMYSAGRMLEGREPEGAGHRWSIRFEAPVTLPGTVAFAAEPQGPKTVRFTGWNPRKARRHFSAELQLP
ncbi:acyl dehydratase [Nesterenkonia sandarakina]|uniref:Acyl dehydratase n=2 Tax=Nesterenkonia sandarakina TaxID=272918 RepID=A0A2T0YLM1_9MICC|nr:acyl dehydratase [Nesterenkonia sandarakina]